MSSFVLDGVTKWYTPGTPVLTDVTLRYEGSGAIGYLGPNGAGKTTTLKLLVGLLAPSRGHAYLNGVDPLRDRKGALWDAGAVIEDPQPYPSESVYDALERVGRIRGLSPESIDEAIDRGNEELSLPPLDFRCGWLSKGQRQRVVLAAARMGDPSVLLLDEPMSGMDPGERVQVRRVLRRLRKDHLILMSSHQMADVAEVCDRLVVIDRGRVLVEDTTEEVADRARTQVFDVEFAEALPDAQLEALRSGRFRVTRLGARRIRVRCLDGPERRSDLIRQLGELGPLASFAPSTPPLEEAFRSIIAATPPPDAPSSDA